MHSVIYLSLTLQCGHFTHNSVHVGDNKRGNPHSNPSLVARLDGHHSNSLACTDVGNSTVLASFFRKI